jgi:hypothetical protein
VGIFLDILAATIILGLLLVAVFNQMMNLNQASYEKTFAANVQTNVTAFARILEYDLLKAGYRTSRPAIKFADSTALRFSEVLSYGASDSTIIQYALGGPVSGTSNPRDVMVVRTAGGMSQNMQLGVVHLRFTYFYLPDSLGSSYQMSTPITSVARLDSVRAIHVKMLLESPEVVYSPLSSDSSYEGVFWEKTIVPKNLMKVIQ